MADINTTQNQNANADALNFAIPPNGFGTYLKNILPDDQRVLAGAFSTAMQQIKNIDQVQIDKFAQAVYSTENMFGLNLVNGTDVPTDQSLAKIAQGVCALGGGVHGTFTMSNFFGAMSGLPYPLREIYNGIKKLETDNLKTIYQNLYLAVTWETAVATLTATETSPGSGIWTVSDVQIPNFGGGYGRTGAAAPTVTFVDSLGADTGITASSIINTDPSKLGPNTTTTFGRLQNIFWSKTQTTTLQPVAVVIQNPPGPGWPGMNAVVQTYIDQANTEIESIQNASSANFELANLLNTNWLITGKALKQEQRARYISSAPVPVPFDQWLSISPPIFYSFVDAIPTLAANTLPHMYAQTLENISDLNSVGGQSIIGLMRESRNNQRLKNVGLIVENNLPNDLNPQTKKQLITNNTVPKAIDGPNGYTIPAFTEKPVPSSYYDPCLPGMMCYNEIQYVQNDPVAAILAAPPPAPEPEPPPSPSGYVPPPTPEILPAGTNVVTPDFNFPCEGTVVDPLYGAQPAPVATAIVGTGAAVPCDPPTEYPLGVNQPKNVIPPELDAEFTNSALSPSAPNVQQAINQVIVCNCDCWVK